MTIKGSLLNAFQLNGCYHQGLITWRKDIQDFISKFMNCTINEQLSISPLDSLNHLEIYKKTNLESNLSKHKSITLVYNETQVSAILGKGGHKLNSIRFQSKCWIYVLPVCGFNKPRTQKFKYQALLTTLE